MRISEIYRSIQGEGLLTGTPSTFVRVSGCNLRCWFCDTPFASWTPEGKNLTIAQIVEEVRALECEHVVVTGGEPMIFRDLPALCRALRDTQHHITIETAGTQYRDATCDLMSISPKLSNSTPSRERAGRWSERHEARRDRLDVVQSLMKQCEYQLKFVIDHPPDTDELLGYLERLDQYDRSRVLIMPQGTTENELDSHSRWLFDWCLKNQFRYCDRAHIHWFGNRRGT